MEDSKIRKFCLALDAEIDCASSHGTPDMGKHGACEQCPLAMFLDVTRQLFSQPDKSIYDCVRVAVRRAIPTEAGRQLLAQTIREQMEAKGK